MSFCYKDKSLPNRFLECRLATGLSQAKVALAIGFKGSRYVINSYEHNKRLPNLKTLIKLKNLYNVSLDYLLCLDNFKNHQEFLLNELGIDEKLEELILIANTLDNGKNLVNKSIKSILINAINYESNQD